MDWYSLKSKVVGWFGDIKVFPYPMFIMFGHSAYKMKGHNIRDLIENIEAGDILLRRFDHYLSGLMIPGYWTHSALYVGDNQIIHILGDGIIKEDILTFTRCDDICVLRKVSDDGVSPTEAISAAEGYLESNVQYDFDFKDGPERFYCSEFTHSCYGKPAVLRRPLKKGMILPDDQLHYSDFSVVWSKST